MTGEVLISPLRVVLRSSPTMPMPGDKATIALTVSNSGAAPLLGVRPVLSVVSGSAYAGPLQGPVPAAGGSINPNGGITFVWTLTIGGTGEVAVRAVVTATATGRWVTAEASRALTSPTIPKFRASIGQSPLMVTAGQWFEVQVTVSNTGGVRANEVVPVLSPVSANPPLVAFQSGPRPTKPVSLRPGESAVFSFTYSANGSGIASFTATVSGLADLTPPGLATRAGAAASEKAHAFSGWVKEAHATATAWYDRTIANPPKPPPPTEKPFLAFNGPGDVHWETDGYATLALSATRLVDDPSGPVRMTSTIEGTKREGLWSCVAEFSVPGDLTASATGRFAPAIRLTWPPRGTERALDPRDWTPFRSLRLDAANASGTPLPLTISLVDSKGWRYEEARLLPAASATRIQVSFPAAQEARVDISRLSVFEISVDTTSLKTRPLVYLDRLRFELPPPPPPKRRRAPPRPKVSSTLLTEPGGSATGTAASTR